MAMQLAAGQTTPPPFADSACVGRKITRLLVATLSRVELARGYTLARPIGRCRKRDYSRECAHDHGGGGGGTSLLGRSEARGQTIEANGRGAGIREAAGMKRRPQK